MIPEAKGTPQFKVMTAEPQKGPAASFPAAAFALNVVGEVLFPQARLTGMRRAALIMK